MSGFGDGYYQLLKIVYDNKTIGYTMDFGYEDMENDEDEDADVKGC